MDIIARVLDSVDSSGGGWPVLVLVFVIVAIVYLTRYVLSKQLTMNEQRVVDRKAEFEEQLARERENTSNYRQTTDRMIDAYDKNSEAMNEFTSALRPMLETLNRIDRHLNNGK